MGDAFKTMRNRMNEEKTTAQAGVVFLAQQQNTAGQNIYVTKQEHDESMQKTAETFMQIIQAMDLANQNNENKFTAKESTYKTCILIQCLYNPTTECIGEHSEFCTKLITE